MRRSVAGLSLILGVAAQVSAASQTAGSADEHIRQVIDSLPRDCDLRGLLQAGQHGGGIHQPWMDDMKREGVKEAWFRIRFTWDQGPKRLTVQSATYLSGYCGRGIEIKDVDWLSRISRSGLEGELSEAASLRAEDFLGATLAHAQWKRAHGSVRVVLTDDEWLPDLDGTEGQEIIDSDRTALMDACLNGDEKRVTALLEGGASVNARDQSGWTALMDAVEFGSVRMVRSLLQAGADVNARNRDGEAALMQAIENGKAESAVALVQAGADINMRDRAGLTPLALAVAKDDSAMARRLLAAGAEIEAKWDEGETALLFAAGKHPAVLGILLEAGANVNATDSEGNTPLIWAAKCGSANSVKELLAAHADVHIRNRSGATALSVAESQGSTDVVQLLDQAGERQ